jgi:hypothetical protein
VLNFEAGNRLRAAADRIADLTLARDYAERPALLERYGEAGRAKYRQDVLFNVAALAGALDASDCAIFLRYVAWLKIVLVTRGVALEDVASSLRCMTIALGEDLGANHSIAASFLNQALEQLDSMPTSVPSSLETSSAETAVAQSALEALLRLDSSAARETFKRAVAEGMTLVRIYSGVLPPLMREIGRLWQMNTISVALEHYCSAAVQSILAGFYGSMFATAPPAQRSLLVACVEGEQHELGARTVADVFQLNGWKTIFLGANLPPPWACTIRCAIASPSPVSFSPAVLLVRVDENGLNSLPSSSDAMPCPWSATSTVTSAALARIVTVTVVPLCENFSALLIRLLITCWTRRESRFIGGGGAPAICKRRLMPFLPARIALKATFSRSRLARSTGASCSSSRPASTFE